MTRSRARAQGILAAAAPLLAALTAQSYGLSSIYTLSWVLPTAVVSVVCLAFHAQAGLRRRGLDRLLATTGIAAGLALALPTLSTSPAMSLFFLLAAAAILSDLWFLSDLPTSFGARRSRLAPLGGSLQARSASMAALAGWTLVLLAGMSRQPAWLWGSAGCQAVAAWFILRWGWRSRQKYRHQAAGIAASLLPGVAVLAFAWGEWRLVLTATALVPAAAVLLLPSKEPRLLESIDWLEPIMGHPARLLVFTFLGLSLLGGLVLALPMSASSGRSLGLTDALFTAVSAVCVTGLIVLDTPVDFSLFGQWTIVFLIQLGGLGIMTFSLAALRLLGRRLSLRHEGAAAGLMSSEDRSRIFFAVRRLFLFTMSSEVVGALLLSLFFGLRGDSVTQALWRGVFTSVSAFCNAGFALQSDSLIGYRSDPWVLHTVGLLIILGGISPLAALAVPDLLKRRQVSAQTKLVLVSSALLLVSGALGILAVEWNHTLAGMSFWDRLHNAWFQSVTLRTAGFNSIDISAIRPPTYSLMLLWMFIGGSPGGTAGGIKTTTLSVLLLAVLTAIQGRGTVTAFGRRISRTTVYKSAAIATAGAAMVFMCLVAMQLTQSISSNLAFFEVVSALGTVGLSMGATAQLDGVGKAVIIVAMFMGRVGPLTLFMFLSSRRRGEVWQRPVEEVDVG